jgi:hypothetical protein
MRDTICGCDGSERFFLLQHTMYYCRPKFSRNTVVRVFRPWSSVLEKRTVASLKEVIFCQKVLHLLIQCASRSKEEV